MFRSSFSTTALGRFFTACLLLVSLFAHAGCECGITESPVDDDDDW